MLLPAWMTEPDAESYRLITDPRLPVYRLLHFRALIDASSHRVHIRRNRNRCRAGVQSLRTGVVRRIRIEFVSSMRGVSDHSDSQQTDKLWVTDNSHGLAGLVRVPRKYQMEKQRFEERRVSLGAGSCVHMYGAHATGALAACTGAPSTGGNGSGE